MWVLVMILWTAASPITAHVHLNTYLTLDECTESGIQVAKDMAVAYPGSTDMWFTCTKDASGQI